MKQLWAPWRLAFIEQVSGDSGCIFCEKPALRQDGKTFILWRGRHAYVLMNIYPYTNGHLLIAPYRHIGAIEDLPETVLLDMLRLLQRSIKAIRKAYAPEHPEGLCARRVQYWREPGEGRGGRDRAPCPPAHRAAVERGHELHAAPRGDPCPAAAPKGFLHALEGGVRLRPLGGAASFAAGADVAPRPAEMTANDPPNPRGRPHRAVDHLLLPEPPGRSGPALLRRDHAADAHL